MTRSLDESRSILSILYVAEENHLDIVPTTWEAALPAIGHGGTADVHQSNLNVQTGFAFKRLNDYRIRTRKSTDNYRNLIAEIKILSAPSIRAHPYIVSLEGFSWDVVGDDVWPVLVFEKGHLGNLEEFASSETGKPQSISSRLEICCKIADAISTVHAQGVQHFHELF